MSNLYIGLMSGTSLDGVDIALCEIDNDACKLLHSQEFSFDKELKSEILKMISSSATLRQIGLLDHKLGVFFAQVLSDFLRQNSLKATNIKAIGLHGQTLWHEPSTDFPFSMQLGDANIVVAKTGIQTVADFRRMDMANGGEGAPFAPAFHQFLFQNLEKPLAVVNIGGMANITFLNASLKGFDTGCGNVLLDLWIQRIESKDYDKDGLFAKSGTIHQELLELMLKDNYFQKEPPKSTGREYFNEVWIKECLDHFSKIKAEDVQRTLLELTATIIANELNKTELNLAIICGGGAKNTFLMQRLQALSRSEIKSSDTLGVSGDFMEAMAFAWFAYKRVQREKIDLVSVTGAKKPSLLGAIYG